MKNITENFLPNIYLDQEIKMALLLQLVSKEPINILLVGDPYTGKTTILKEMANQKEKASYCNGTVFSKIITPKNVLIKETLEKTELLCIDDVDSCYREERIVLKDMLTSEISVLASANPKFGRFDPYDLVVNQVDLSSKTIASFDLIFPLKDSPKEEKDRMMANLIFDKHETKPFDLPVRNKVIIDKELQKKMVDYYVKNRATKVDDFLVIKHVLRTFTALIKLTKANAVLNNRLKANEEDFHTAMKIIEYSFVQVARDANLGGVIDIDRISSAKLTAPERNKQRTVLEIVQMLSGRLIPIEDIVREGKNLGLNKDEIEVILERLRKSCNISEPRTGFIALEGY